MVWIVEGKLKQQPNVELISTSHYLRPERTYKIGSATGDYSDSKTNKTFHRKSKMLDFTLNPAASISKKGVGELITKSWDHVDDILDDSTIYELTYTSQSKSGIQVIKRIIEGKEGTIKLDQSEPFPLQSGDLIRLPNKNEMSVTWIPLNFCIAGAAPNLQQRCLERAKMFGFKVSFQDPTPHHTHFVSKSAVTSRQHCLAAMLTLPIVTLDFYKQFEQRLRPPVRTTEIDSIIQTYREQSINSGGTGELTEEMEQELVEKLTNEGSALGGGDYLKYWGHSILENDWEERPRESGLIPVSTNDVGTRKVDWSLREDRQIMFVGILFISTRDKPDIDKFDEDLIKQGGGNYLNLSITIESTVKSLIDLVEKFKIDKELNVDVKTILIPSSKISFTEEEGEGGKKKDESEISKITREFAKNIGVRNYQNSTSIAHAIAEVNPSILFNSAQENNSTATSTSKNGKGKARTLAPDSSLNQPPTPSSTSGTYNNNASIPSNSSYSTLAESVRVGGTHPEESSYALSGTTGRGRGGSLGGGLGGAGEEGGGNGDGDEEMAPPAPVKKLTRRTKTTTTSNAASSTYDDIWGVNLQTQPTGPEFSLETSSTNNIGTRAGGGGGGGDPNSSLQVEELNSSISRVPTKLKRRVGTTTTTTSNSQSNSTSQSNAMEGVVEQPEESEDDDLFLPTSTSRPIKKSHQQILEEEEEEREDERLALEHANQAKKRAQSLLEGKSKGGKKRGASEAVSSDEDGGKVSGKPVNKKSKSTTTTNNQDEEEEEQQESIGKSSTSKSGRVLPKNPTTTAPSKPLTVKEKAKQKAEAKEKEKKETEGILKVQIPKRKGKESDAMFAEEFNALKIIKPTLIPMKAKKVYKQGWNDLDEEEEELRLQREAEEKSRMPEKWTQENKGKSFFVIEYLNMERKDRVVPRTDIELEEKYVGRLNFKRFRPKNSINNPAPIHRPNIELVLTEPADFGLGGAYRGGAEKESYEDDDDMREPGQQSKLNFKSKPKPKVTVSKATGKGKGKAKAITTDESDSEEEDEDEQFSNSKNKKKNQDEMEIDELDSDDSDDESITQTLTSNKGKSNASGSGSSKSKSASTVSSKKAPAKKSVPAAAAAAAKKKLPAVIVIDSDSDESDSGLTFKGFNSTAKPTGGTKRKR